MNTPSLQALQYVSDPLQSLKVLLELLKPGGYLLLSSPFIQIVRQHTIYTEATHIIICFSL